MSARIEVCQHSVAYCIPCRDEAREAGRREGRAEGAEIARLFSKFGWEKQADPRLEDIRAGHVLSALSIAEHLDGMASGARIHDACPGCDLIERLAGREGREAGGGGVNRYRRKPSIIEAVKFDPRQFPRPEGVFEDEDTPGGYALWNELHQSWIKIKAGDFIRIDNPNDRYPIAAEVMAATYELLDGQ